MNDSQISYSLGTIDRAADLFWQYAHRYRVVCFHGQMGAGKTTFCAALAKHIGVSTPLSSPTYSLMQAYDVPLQNGSDQLMHMDLYRIKTLEEAFDAGILHELEQANNLCWIEWPNLIEEQLTKPYFKAFLELGNDAEERIIRWEEIA